MSVTAPGRAGFIFLVQRLSRIEHWGPIRLRGQGHRYRSGSPQPSLAMPPIHRRAVLAGVAAISMTRLVDPAFPQDVPAPVFSHGDVIKRARDLAATPF